MCLVGSNYFSYVYALENVLEIVIKCHLNFPKCEVLYFSYVSFKKSFEIISWSFSEFHDNVWGIQQKNFLRDLSEWYEAEICSKKQKSTEEVWLCL